MAVESLVLNTNPRPPSRSGVYRILCEPTGKFYIGSAVDLQNRRSVHFSELRNNKHCNSFLQKAWNKYGEEKFSFDVLLICSRKDLVFYEQRAIGILTPEFNMVPRAGSVLGRVHSEETRKKIAIKAKLERNSEAGKRRVREQALRQWADPEKRAYMIRALTGRTYKVKSPRKPISDNTRKKMSLSAKKRFENSEYKQQVLERLNGRHKGETDDV